MSVTEDNSTKDSVIYNPEVDYKNDPDSFTVARYVIEVCTKLNTTVETTATALSYFHTFYQFASHDDFDPFTIGCTCIYLASKVVDDDIRLRDIINVGLSSLNRNSAPLMLEPYFTMRDSLTQAELLLMRVLKFKLKIDLPHKYILHYLRSLEDWLGRDVFRNLPISATAWKVLQDTYHDDMVIKIPPEVLAVASLHIALDMCGAVVPSDAIQPWYSVLHEQCTKKNITEISLQILDLYDKEKKLKFISSEQQNLV